MLVSTCLLSKPGIFPDYLKTPKVLLWGNKTLMQTAIRFSTYALIIYLQNLEKLLNFIKFFILIEYLSGETTILYSCQDPCGISWEIHPDFSKVFDVVNQNADEETLWQWQYKVLLFHRFHIYLIGRSSKVNLGDSKSNCLPRGWGCFGCRFGSHSIFIFCQTLM